MNGTVTCPKYSTILVVESPRNGKATTLQDDNVQVIGQVL